MIFLGKVVKILSQKSAVPQQYGKFGFRFEQTDVFIRDIFAIGFQQTFVLHNQRFGHGEAARCQQFVYVHRRKQLPHFLNRIDIIGLVNVRVVLPVHLIFGERLFKREKRLSIRRRLLCGIAAQQEQFFDISAVALHIFGIHILIFFFALRGRVSLHGEHIFVAVFCVHSQFKRQQTAERQFLHHFQLQRVQFFHRLHLL